MPRPVIGVTSSCEDDHGGPDGVRAYVNAAYPDAVFAAGGLPVPLCAPPAVDAAIVKGLLSRVDNIFFTGGADVDPQYYGQSPHPRTQVMHQRRDRFELEFFRRADAADKPILSICPGCQVAAVARGGCLVQHVDDLPRVGAVEHYKPDHGTAFHPVVVECDSLLARILGTRWLEVNSRHHQVMDRSRVGGWLRPVAFAPDGVVEAVEDPSRRFFVSVQWHPEDLIDRAEHLRLFQALVVAAAAAR